MKKFLIILILSNSLYAQKTFERKNGNVLVYRYLFSTFEYSVIAAGGLVYLGLGSVITSIVLPPFIKKGDLVYLYVLGLGCASNATGLAILYYLVWLDYLNKDKPVMILTKHGLWHESYGAFAWDTVKSVFIKPNIHVREGLILQENSFDDLYIEPHIPTLVSLEMNTGEKKELSCSTAISFKELRSLIKEFYPPNATG